ncbi:spermatogenesis-associated serine-rich protein 1 [Paroedura picta]|uniref:spermatogenesis-associated serine-rich protein 1 n=1 Tax=Paroedura picta TaxID=143630 RepID=UPI00405636DF
MKGEGNAASSGDNNANGFWRKDAPSLPVQGHGTARSSQEKDSSSSSLQQSNSEEILGLVHETSKESSPSEPSSPSKPGSSSPSPQLSKAPLETKLEEDVDQFLKDILQEPVRRKGHTDKEWTFYPSSSHLTYHAGKKCVFDGLHLRNKTSTSERTLEKSFGKKKNATEIDSRNGIPMVTPGDQPYSCPEQSKDFYKMGSTMTSVNFGSVSYTKKSDTFIPLQRLPADPCLPYRIKEKQREQEREKLEVKNLDLWKPAPSLLQTFFVTSLGRRMTYQPY